ncbi:unnamed protein product [Soboliphyme baturini]|uniref:SEC63 domain-containing protein n=1 Tax=Soboliphyme baturini TaxID=241478 RepID=A0A3P8CCU7_9BILA|nr:unnamed protein product [Soboliphyme baturini]
MGTPTESSFILSCQRDVDSSIENKISRSGGPMLAMSCPIKMDQDSYDDPHTKAYLLYQAHFSRIQLPSTDFETDAKLVLDQAPRIMQPIIAVSKAMLDVCAENGWLAASLRMVDLMHMVYQGRWNVDIDLSTLPHITTTIAEQLIERLIIQTIRLLPMMNISVKVQGLWQGETRVRIIEATEISSSTTWLTLYSDTEYVLCVDLLRRNKLIALKRVGPVKRNATVNVLFTTSSKLGRIVYTLYILSDCYYGLDQQYSLPFDVVPSGTEVVPDLESYN